jgi:hypothetical protein
MMRSVIPLLGLFVLLGCEGPEAPDTSTAPATQGTADEGAASTGAMFGPAPVSALEPTVQVMSTPAQGETLVDAQGEGQLLRGVFNPEALRAFQATRSQTWRGAK